MKTYIKPIDNSVMNAGQKATDIYPTDLIEKKKIKTISTVVNNLLKAYKNFFMLFERSVLHDCIQYPYRSCNGNPKQVATKLSKAFQCSFIHF